MSKARKSPRKSTRRKSVTVETNQKLGISPKSSMSVQRRPFKTLVYSILLGIAVFGGWSVWQSKTCEAAFLDLANANQGSLQNVRTMRDLGRNHLARGQSYRYPDRIPTSGPHSPGWTRPGLYTTSQPDIQLVHALEHGNVVIYYDQLSTDDFSTLESWAQLYTQQWSGVVVTKKAGLNNAVVLTAWRKILRMKTFDASSAALFVDKYRGRGPEHSVR